MLILLSLQVGEVARHKHLEVPDSATPLIISASVADQITPLVVPELATNAVESASNPAVEKTNTPAEAERGGAFVYRRKATGERNGEIFVFHCFCSGKINFSE